MAVKYFVLSCLCLCLWICSTNQGVLGTELPVKWSGDILQCSKAGLVVVEQAFYTTPPSGVCDRHCRSGPDAKGRNCFFVNNTKCVQEVTPEEVKAIYNTCDLPSAPARCDLSRSGLAKSLVVGFNCLSGRLFDPYNLIVAWKAHEITFALGCNSSVTDYVITRCLVKPESRQSNSTIKMTTLRLTGDVYSNETGENETDQKALPSDDVIVHSDNVMLRVEPSVYPKWLSLPETQFTIVFEQRVNSDRSLPFWVSFYDADNIIDVTCEPLRITTTPFTSTVRETTQKPMTTPPTTEPVTQPTSDSTFTLIDVLIAVFVTAGAIMVLVICICCLQRWKRCRRENAFENLERGQNRDRPLIPRAEYHNEGHDSYVVTSLDADRAPCSGIQERHPCNADRLPRGSGLSNGVYDLFSDVTDNIAAVADSTNDPHSKESTNRKLPPIEPGKMDSRTKGNELQDVQAKGSAKAEGSKPGIFNKGSKKRKGSKPMSPDPKEPNPARCCSAGDGYITPTAVPPSLTAQAAPGGHAAGMATSSRLDSTDKAGMLASRSLQEPLGAFKTFQESQDKQGPQLRVNLDSKGGKKIDELTQQSLHSEAASENPYEGTKKTEEDEENVYMEIHDDDGGCRG